MAFDKTQFRGLIIDVLQEAGLYSPAAVELLMLTAAVESNLGTYLKQVSGPAVGVFQMEPRTHDDIWENYLKFKSSYQQTEQDKAERLRWDIKYAIMMARIHYLRVPEPLPNATNVEALAQYWKDHYNTHLGAGTVEKAIEKYERYCG